MPDPDPEQARPAASQVVETLRTKGEPAPLRVRAAWMVALIADALQLAVFPLVIAGGVSPLDDVVDAVVGLVLIALLGWNLAFLPSFVIKLLPVVDLAPMWTLAVAYVTRRTAPARR